MLGCFDLLELVKGVLLHWSFRVGFLTQNWRNNWLTLLNCIFCEIIDWLLLLDLHAHADLSRIECLCLLMDFVLLLEDFSLLLLADELAHLLCQLVVLQLVTELDDKLDGLGEVKEVQVGQDLVLLTFHYGLAYGLDHELIKVLLFGGDVLLVQDGV